MCKVRSFFVNWSMEVSAGIFSTKWLPQETELIVFNEREIIDHKLTDSRSLTKTEYLYLIETSYICTSVSEYIAREIYRTLHIMAQDGKYRFRIDNIIEIQ